MIDFKEMLNDHAITNMMTESETTGTIWWKQGFYDQPVEGAKEITGRYWQELLRGQENGYCIEEDESGFPVLGVPGPKTYEQWREWLFERIRAHERDEQVRSFIVAGNSMWLDAPSRISLASSLEAERAAGRTLTTLWTQTEPPVAVELPIDEAQRLLAAVEIYAKDVYDAARRHIAAAHMLDSIEAIKEYDYTQGYPDKLVF